MIVGRLIGWAFLAAAVMAAGHEAFTAVQQGSYRFIALGELWYAADPASLNLAQAVVQRYLFPALWDIGIVWVLARPAWTVFAAVGLVIWLLFRRRTRRRRSFS